MAHFREIKKIFEMFLETKSVSFFLFFKLLSHNNEE